MSIRIMSDSTSDIGPEKAKEWGVTLIPLKVIFGEEEFQDGVDLQLDEFYNRLVTSEKLPTTSQPDPERFLTVFQEAKAAGDEVVLFTISSNLSGTYQSASIAKEICGYDKIYIIDSLQVTSSMLLMVRRALALCKEGKTGAEIAAILEGEKSRYRLYGAVSDLKYLEKGGRLSKVGAAAGSMLNLKPVITISEEGVVKLAGMARGQKGAYAKLLKLIEADGGLDTSREFCIGYTGDEEVMTPYREYLAEKLDMKNSLEHRIGTVIGTHGGPGCSVFGAFLKEDTTS